MKKTENKVIKLSNKIMLGKPYTVTVPVTVEVTMTVPNATSEKDAIRQATSHYNSIENDPTEPTIDEECFISLAKNKAKARRVLE